MTTPQDPGSQLKSVYTPGGPRTADQVHTVGADEIVAADEAGRYRVSNRAALTLKRTRQLLATGDYGITPGGVRPNSMIHLVAPDEIVRHDGVQMRRFNTRTETFIDAPKITLAAPELPGLGSGWITWAAYVESAANVIRSMTTTWTVPPEPSTENGQLLYLFNGLQDSPVTQILQPVLQWGRSPAGGGTSWALASWLVSASGDAFRTQTLVQVQPGDVLTGVMKLVSTHTTFSFWTCEFVGLPDTRLFVNVSGHWSCRCRPSRPTRSLSVATTPRR